jgi:hypothetical protein
MLNNKN